MSFQKSALSEVFKSSYALANRNEFNDAKKLVLDCVPLKNQNFLKDFEKFPAKVLPVNKAAEWIIENIAYGEESVPEQFAKINWNIAIGDDHVFYIDIECQDATQKRIEGMLNESMMVLETLNAEDYGFNHLGSGCDSWCEIGEEKIEGLQFKGKDVGSRTVYDSFAAVILLDYVAKLQKALVANKKFERIQFNHSISSLDDSGKRQHIA